MKILKETNVFLVIKQLNKKFSYGWAILFLSIIFLVIRLPFLDQMFLLHDERDMTLTGYYLANYGIDLNGIKFPLSFEELNPNAPFVPYYFSAFWWSIISFKTVFLARLPYVIITTLYVLLVYKISFLITKEKRFSLITSIVFCFSPWIFHISRLALEANLALLFTISGAIFFFQGKRFFSYLFLSLAFFSYQGFRILIPPFLVYLELYNYFFIDKKNKILIKNISLHALFFILLLFASQLIDGNLTKSRVTELIFLNKPLLENQVYVKRATSIASPLLKEIFNNKLTESLDHILNTAITGFGLNFLFKQGDPSPIYGSTSTGQFFLLFIPFFVITFLKVSFSKQSKRYFYIFGFSIIGMIPSFLSSNNVTFALRSSFACLGYSAIIAFGLNTFLTTHFTFSKKIKYLSFLLLIILVIFSVGNFTYNYFLRRPITVGELFYERERSLAQYIKANEKNTNVISARPNDLYLSTVFLENKLKIENIENDKENKKIQKFGQTTFLNCEGLKFDTNNSVQTIIISETCLSEKQHDIFSADIEIQKIPYRDFSFRNAFFIMSKNRFDELFRFL